MKFSIAKPSVREVRTGHGFVNRFVTYRDDSNLHPFATEIDAHNGNFLANADESGDYEQG